MHNRRGAEQNIQGQIDTAPNFPEIPVAHELIRQRERHHQGGDQDVRGGQRHQKEVLRGFQRPARQHRDHHQDIPNNSEEDEETYEGSDAGYRCQRVSAVRTPGGIQVDHRERVHSAGVERIHPDRAYISRSGWMLAWVQISNDHQERVRGDNMMKRFPLWSLLFKCISA